MKFPWFNRVGFLFKPMSIIGWVILFAAIVYSVYVFIDIDRSSHSVSDTLISFVFNLLIIMAVYSTVGFLTSKRG